MQDAPLPPLPPEPPPGFILDTGPTAAQLGLGLGAAIVIVAILGWTMVRLLTPLVQAYAARLRGDADPTELQELRHEVAELRMSHAELAERLDFAERLLGEQRAASLPLNRGQG